MKEAIQKKSGGRQAAEESTVRYIRETEHRRFQSGAVCLIAVVFLTMLPFFAVLSLSERAAAARETRRILGYDAGRPPVWHEALHFTMDGSQKTERDGKTVWNYQPALEKTIQDREKRKADFYQKQQKEMAAARYQGVMKTRGRYAPAVRSLWWLFGTVAVAGALSLYDRYRPYRKGRPMRIRYGICVGKERCGPPYHKFSAIAVRQEGSGETRCIPVSRRLYDRMECGSFVLLAAAEGTTRIHAYLPPTGAPPCGAARQAGKHPDLARKK